MTAPFNSTKSLTRKAAQRSLMIYALCLTVVLTLLSSPALAVETVKSPLISEGDWQLENIGKYQYDSNPRRDDQKEYGLSVAYGVTDRWRTKLQTEYEDKGSGHFHYKDFNWENIVSLTGNTSPVPVAFYLNLLAANRSDSSHSALTGFIFMKELGPTVNTVNLFLRHEFGDTASNKTSVVYRFQSRYHLYSYFDPGFELWGDTNKQDEFKNQSLKIGPGAFGKFGIAGADNFGYELVFLFGATPGSHDGTLKWRLTYDFP